MQLVACSPQLKIDIRAEQEHFTPKGDRLPTTRALFIQFRPGGNVSDHARALVQTIPGFTAGISRDQDPFTRLGWWDSRVAQVENSWTDEEHDYVVERIRIVGDPNIRELEELKVDAPYAKYDAHRKVHGKRTLEHVFADISATYEIAGFDVELASIYERQNLNDEKVLAFLSTLGVGEPNTDELIAA